MTSKIHRSREPPRDSPLYNFIPVFSNVGILAASQRRSDFAGIATIVASLVMCIAFEIVTLNGFEKRMAQTTYSTGQAINMKIKGWSRRRKMEILQAPTIAMMAAIVGFLIEPFSVILKNLTAKIPSHPTDFPAHSRDHGHTKESDLNPTFPI